MLDHWGYRLDCDLRLAWQRFERLNHGILCLLDKTHNVVLLADVVALDLGDALPGLIVL